MCGRYYRRSDKQRIAETFHLGQLPEGFVLPPWDYNVAPTTHQPVIRHNRDTGQRELVLMRWGLIPFFAESLDQYKDLSTINARSSTLLQRPTWREPFKRHRCIVPADGLYEWPVPGKAVSPTYYPTTAVETPEGGSGNLFDAQVQPAKRTKASVPIKRVFAISMADDRPFAFAGLWDRWKDPVGNWLESFALVTTEPNELVSTIHDRLALILKPKDYDRWLTTDDREDPRLPLDLLHPLDSDEMKMVRANPAVGNWRNNGPEMLSTV
jgi:putative SOS response-associated peptidase YedK